MLRAQVQLVLALSRLAGRAREAIDERRADERGAIPAEVAWIAGIVILAIAVVAIIAATTKTKASSIQLGN